MQTEQKQEALNPAMLASDEIFGAVAIIGMAGRFPGADDVEQFWRNVRDGVESITFFGDDELLAAGVEPDLLRKPNYVKANGLLAGADCFDANFFGLSPREAAATDPQHRVFLECAWSALEDAGYDAPRYPGRIGVFAGVGTNSYFYNNLIQSQTPSAISDMLQMGIGNDKDFVPTRVSYLLNLTGPSINVNTACSSGLVAVCLAVQSLLSYQADMVLAGAVSIHVPQESGYLYQEGMILSPDGHCRAFDAQAQGTVGGDGVGIVVLKRLDEALAAGDTIHAVIRGCAINNDGANKVGYTAPSVEGQAAVIAEALAMADLSPATVTYVETHGTGTPLGDPIEIAALTEVFQATMPTKQYCAIGSVKTNLGHTDAAAGVAGLIKTVQALKHRQLPPSLHYHQPNPNIDFANSPFFVNTQLQAWHHDTTPRRAGVSSFGIGGTNAHVVVEEAPKRPPSAPGRAWQLLPLSAKTPAALAQAATNLADHLQTHADLALADVAFTLTNRQPMAYRHTLVVQDLQQAKAQLAAFSERSLLSQPASKTETAPRIAFMFSGQGTQYSNMGHDLYVGEPIFRASVDQCAALLAPHLGLDLRGLLYPALYPSGDPALAATALQQTAIVQPAIFTIEYALAQLWLAWGIRPAALIGHSIGEYVAACLAGVFSLADGLALVAARGRLMQGLPGGAMLAVSLPVAAVRPYLNDQLAIAAINETDQAVIAGETAAIEALSTTLTAAGINCRRLHTSHAFHSPMMEPILADFAACVARIALHAPTIPYLSNVTGDWITAQAATSPAYWVTHLRQSVQFAAGLTTLRAAADLLVEVGPGRTLATFARRHADYDPATVFTSLRHPQAEQADQAHLLSTLGQLWQQGITIDWDSYYANESRQRLSLPTYPFARQRHWIEPTAAQKTAHSAQTQASTPTRQPSQDWFYVPTWQQAPLPRRGLTTAQQWLLFVDETGLGAALATALRQAGQAVITVQAGAAFAQLSAEDFTIRPAEPDDYTRLWQALPFTPQRIVQLWNVSATAVMAQPTTATLLAEAQQTALSSFYSLLYFAQSLGQQQVTTAIDLCLITDQLYNITGSEPIQPSKALLLGPLQVLPQEYPNLTCRLIDVGPALSAGNRQTTINQLLTEFATQGEAQVIAYRGAHRWLAGTQPLRLPESTPTLRHGGVYLITGGLGGIGLTLAETLAAARPTLVLLGRAAFPARATWADWLADHGPTDPTSQQISRLQGLAAAGATLFIQSVDVSDQVAMQAVIADVGQRFGAIHGVIHAAGIGGANLIAQRDDAALAAVLAPKVQGTLVLEALLQDEPLDFFVLCSSLSAFLGGVGQVAYTAANAFQDAFAQSRAQRYPCLSLNWDAWREVGMAADQFAEGRQGAPQADYGLYPAQGQQLFGQALASGLPQLLISTLDFAQLRHHLRQTAQLPTVTASSKQDRSMLGIDYVAPRTPVESWLAGIWQTYLALAPIGVADDYFLHLGQDSLNAMALINRIQDELGALVHLQMIFEAPTIAQMATYLEAHYAEQLHTKLGITIDPTQPATALVTPALVTQVRQTLAAQRPTFIPPTSQCPPALFILSPPRAGSTLLRTLLAGHPQLFAPPELGLLCYNTLAELLADDPKHLNRQGLIRTLMQLYNCSAEQAAAQLVDDAAQQLSIAQFYQHIQAQIGERLLVDKTPTYALDPAIMQRAEVLFANARFVHLTRHPYGMIHSYEEARIDQLTWPQTAPIGRRALAEATWLISHEHILTFLRDIPAQRQHWLTFEDLVTEPQQTLAQLCHFLAIDFDPVMLDLYGNAHERMTDGTRAGGRMMGDIKFHQHSGITPTTAHRWRTAYTTDFLSDETWALAAQLGYTERINPLAALPQQPPAVTVSTPQAAALLKQIDELSEAQMDELLATLLEN